MVDSYGLNSVDIKLVVCDFDDTLCMHTALNHCIDDDVYRYNFLQCALQGKSPYSDFDRPAPYMDRFLCKFKQKGVPVVTVTIVYTSLDMISKSNWLLGEYTCKFDSVIGVGDAEDKISTLEDLCRFYNIKKEEALLIDDRRDIRKMAISKGFNAMSPEAVTYNEMIGWA